VLLFEWIFPIIFDETNCSLTKIWSLGTGPVLLLCNIQKWRNSTVSSPLQSRWVMTKETVLGANGTGKAKDHFLSNMMNYHFMHIKTIYTLQTMKTC
jgi:hypothetical protein